MFLLTSLPRDVEISKFALSNLNMISLLAPSDYIRKKQPTACKPAAE